MEWKSKEWQGKRKDQVESSYRIIYMIIMAMTIFCIVFLLTSCKSAKACYVQRSNITITNDQEGLIYIRNNDVGQMIYSHWVRGTYGSDYKPVLVTDSTFNVLIRK